MNKVLKGLKQCLREPGTEMQCGDCPYYRQGERVEDCMDRLMKDATDRMDQLEEFARWVGMYIFADDWETNQDVYTEIIRRKIGELYRLNMVVK